MRIAKLQFCDIANGPGIRVSLWMQGCPFHCPGCQNPETWNFEGGQEVDLINVIVAIIQELSKSYYSGLSILGGEPLAPQNRADVATIIEVIKEVYPDIKIWLWTGYTIEELRNMQDLHIDYILNTLNVIVDGPYIEAERDLSLPHAGSRNQRVIHLTE
ncbi:MAG: anaerobic ribonucleoside-triphosphate reductase activating protein [Prevotella sp.]|nr:anaerobic ribonucleoside-triphosphate reductase activating protein [Prevotella sp.]